MNFHNTKFMTSAPDISKLPDDEGIEIAFMGRSNAGKSTALNVLTGQRNLAKTSKTPGRTQLINIFEVEPNKRITDLPGYGFADVPIPVKNKWQAALTTKKKKRKSLRALVLLMDIRHPLTDLDRQIINWSAAANLDMLILLTKCDKLAKNARQKAFFDVKKMMVEFGINYNIVLFSSINRVGIEEATKILSQWYDDMPEASSSIPDANTNKTDSSDKNDFDEEKWQNYRNNNL